MLHLLLDEHISSKVADGLRRLLPELPVVALTAWEGGRLVGVSDDLLLAAALEQERTLVTFDLRTILPLLKAWAEQGRSHGGVILVDDRTMASSDFGGLTRSLANLWAAQRDWEWQDRVVFLERHPLS